MKFKQILSVMLIIFCCSHSFGFRLDIYDKTKNVNVNVLKKEVKSGDHVCHKDFCCEFTATKTSVKSIKLLNLICSETKNPEGYKFVANGNCNFEEDLKIQNDVVGTMIELLKIKDSKLKALYSVSIICE